MYQLRKLYILILTFLTLELLVMVRQVDCLKFAISHFNDVNGQIEKYMDGTANSSVAPTPCDQANCIGGAVAIGHWLRNATYFSDVNEKNLIRLSSGNLVGGESGWISAVSDGFSRYGELVRDHYKPNVMTLGMKEFGGGINNTIEFVNATVSSNETTVLLPVNACRKDMGENPAEDKFLCKAFPRVHKISLREGETEHLIGVIGFVDPTVEQLSLPGRIKFDDVVSNLKETTEAADSLKTFIAIGDGDLELAKSILDNVEKVKLVIYSTGAALTETKLDQYPMPYKNGYIVTAGRFGSSVGKLVLDLNTDSGAITHVQGKLVLTTFPEPLRQEDQDTITTVAAWRGDVKLLQTGFAYTSVVLQGGENCRRNECNLGNLVTNAAIHCTYQVPNATFDYPIHSIWHAGAFFEDKVDNGTEISEFDFRTWFPSFNRAHLVSVLGYNLRKIFELSAGGIDPEKANVQDWGQFLQVSSGFEVYYTTTSGKPELQKIRLVHDNHGRPLVKDLDDNVRYYVVIPTFLKEGRGIYGLAKASGFWSIVKAGQVTDPYIGFDYDCVFNYVKAIGKITLGMEERIFIDENPEERTNHCECKVENVAITVILTIIFFVIFLVVMYIGCCIVIPRLRRTNEGVAYPPNQS